MSDRKSPDARFETDPPRDDLKKERDDFIKTFFRKGVELTEELVREREQSRSRIILLEEENARLRAQIASEGAMRELLRKIEELEREKELVLNKFREAEALSNRTEANFQEIESELANLANLYVASYQLHASLNPRGAMQHIKELLAQFIGAEAFAVYLLDEAGAELVPVATEGVSDGQLMSVAAGQGLIGDAFSSGKLQVFGGDPRQGTLEAPAACIPLRMDDQTPGIIVVFRTLEQKASFVQVDHELFKLLGAQAMSALVAARLFTDKGREIPTLSSFRDLGI